MNPIKNVFTACEGSETRYSSERKCWLDEEETNGSVGWTKRRQSWKSGDKTPVETATDFKCFESVPNERHIVLSFGRL